MRFNRFGRVLAMALLASSISIPADAAPKKRPVASATAKKKAAAAAAKKEAARLAAEAAAKAAAEAAEKARLRAQWGLLADIGDADFQTPEGMPVTVRRDANATELTFWGPLARAAIRLQRDPASGAMTLSTPGQWSRKTYPARILSDGSIEATAKNESRWTVIARQADGTYLLASGPGAKIVFAALQPGGKAATKLASLISAGKVRSLGALEPNTALAAAGAGSVPGTPPLPPMVDTLVFFRSLRGNWTNGQGMWSFTPGDSGVAYDFWTHRGKLSANVQIRSRDGQYYSGTGKIIPVGGGYYFSDVKYAMFPTADGGFQIRLVKLKKGQLVDYQLKSSIIHGPYRRMNDSEVAEWQTKAEQVRLAEVRRQQQQQQSGGNSGWLGGLIMGGVAAAAGGDAGMVMGAAMKGVEMTTDNEMTRSVLAGKGDEMIQSSVDLQNQKAELERLRVAAEEETRRKREAEAAAARAAENARRVAEANARQQAIADEFAAKQAANDAAKNQRAALDEAARAKRLTEQKQRDAEAKAAEQEAAARAERERRDAQAAAEAEKRRAAEAQRLAELKRKQDEAARPIAMKEGVVLCAKQRENYYRCEGPLQVTYSDLKTPAGMTSIKEACGSNTPRDLGMAGSFRVFGCGFGINPYSSAPGNRDVPASYGLFVDGRGTFYCPRSKDAYCRS